MLNLSVYASRLVSSREDFTPGHRGCIGCGEALAVRHVMKALGNDIILANATGCIEIISSSFPTSAWKVPWIHTLFENTAAVASGIEAAYKVMKKKGRYPKDQPVKVVAIGGDGGTADIGIQALSGALERYHDFIYVCFDNEAYMNCLSTTSYIQTADGLKRITDVKDGEPVYTFDQNSHELVLRRCTGIFKNGFWPIFELTTLHHTIKATSNHPFLVLERNGRGRENTLVWKTLKEVKKGDMIVVLKNMGEEASYRFNFDETQVGDYKVTHVNEINIPKCTSPELMEYLGIYMGDGWVRPERGETGFALPHGKRAREVLTKLQKDVFQIEPTRSDENYIYVNSVNLARFINSLGFGKGAKNKTIPPWVFTLPREEKEAFVRGLILSDGYSVKESRSTRYVSASKELLKTLSLLLQTINYRVGKIHMQKREKGTHCVYEPVAKGAKPACHSRESGNPVHLSELDPCFRRDDRTFATGSYRDLKEDTEFGYICFSKKKDWNVKKYKSQYRYQNLLVENKYFDLEKVTNIKRGIVEPTLDLRVVGNHNFIANGIVVHNTGVQRSSETPFGASTSTSPAGTESIGQVTWKKNMPAIAIAHNIPYVATANPSYPFDLIEKVKKAKHVKGPTYIHVYSACPTGWRTAPDLSIRLGRLAVETGVFPLYEHENGGYKLSLNFEKLLPVDQYLKSQGRFKHLNEENIKYIQERIEREWEELKKRCER